MSLLVTWTGWDVRGGASAEEGAVEAFRAAAPPDAGPSNHYALLAVAGRGFRPPRLLSSVPSDGEATPDTPPEPVGAGLRVTWSLVYRRIAETGPEVVKPYAIYLLGVDPPEGASNDELDVFNDFYTDVHLREVAERRQALRAVRFELVRELRAPYRRAPQFLAVYEVDETSAANRRHVGPPYSKGPEVWQRHTTPWRLWYRRLGAEDAPPS